MRFWIVFSGDYFSVEDLFPGDYFTVEGLFPGDYFSVEGLFSGDYFSVEGLRGQADLLVFALNPKPSYPDGFPPRCWLLRSLYVQRFKEASLLHEPKP